MSARTPRLAVGEWNKIRRRWMPWVLLGIILLITQALFWASYIQFHVSDDQFGLVEQYEHFHGDGSIVITCEDVLEGRDADRIERIADTLAGESEQSVRAEVAEWRSSCALYVTPDEEQRALTLPGGTASLLGGMTLVLAIPVLILAASVMGMEYGWGTLRTTLARGIGRRQFLSGKLVMLMAVATGWVAVVAVSCGVAGLLAAVLPPDEAGTLISGDRGAWLDAVTVAAKLAFTLAPYVALGVFMAVLTQSTAMGISLSMGYYVLELAVAPLLGGVADWLADVLDVALLGSNASEWMHEAGSTEIEQVLGIVAEEPDTLRAFLVLLAYTAALIAAALWLFQRRDITGARGE